MRNVVTTISAAVTAIFIGLLIANVASAARAAEIDHAKQQQLAALEASYSDNDIRTQLAAYQIRYEQAYKQLALAYQALAARDAQYRALLGQSGGTSAQLAAANADLDAKLAAAYAALDAAQAMVNDLASRNGQAPGGAAVPATAAPAGQTAAPRTAAPAAVPPGPVTQPPVTARPTPLPQATYCWYDADGKWVCEDHPRGQ